MNKHNKNSMKIIKKELEPVLKQAMKEAFLQMSEEDRRVVMQTFTRKGITIVASTTKTVAVD